MSRRSATSASPGVTATPTATDFSAPSTLPRGDDVPPTRPHIRATAEAYPARHQHEREAEDEPDLCVEWPWWDPRDLPAGIVPYTRLATDGILRGRLYSEMGW
ncbi:hypothetical protein [Streptomyces sp. NPDC086182]|uniref:hypothetical protein n=1 Tax=Streptomyces sp. NPDC086182 TaxID=3155058 RepID=UPI0034128FCA